MCSKTILLLGCGYVGQRFLQQAGKHRDWRILPVSRNPENIHRWQQQGWQAVHLTDRPDHLDGELLQQVDTIIDSIPLMRNEAGIHAPQADWLPALLAQCSALQQAIYLSSSSVYGDAAGAWVDEQWLCQPSSVRGRQRLLAEQCWQGSEIALAIFRLSGIYGPQRNLASRLHTGNYTAVQWHPPRYSNRIHVDDIVQCLLAAIDRRTTGIFNISDDLPLPHAEYVQQLADCIHAPAPRLVPPEEAAQYLTPAALSFFRDNKRLSNQRLHRELCPQLLYPDFLSYFRSYSETSV